MTTKIVYRNPNIGSSWLMTKMYEIPGMFKYYKSDPAKILYGEPLIVSDFGYLIEQIIIIGNQVIYRFSTRPDIVEYVDPEGMANLTRYLRKIGWRSVQTSYQTNGQVKESQVETNIPVA